MTYGKWCDIKYQEILDHHQNIGYFHTVSTFYPKRITIKNKRLKMYTRQFFLYFPKIKTFLLKFVCFPDFYPILTKKVLFLFCFSFFNLENRQSVKMFTKMKISRPLYIFLYPKRVCRFKNEFSMIIYDFSKLRADPPKSCTFLQNVLKWSILY
jgi:hypothetical protein